MTFSRSRRLLKAYEHCRVYYCGMGPAGKKPARLKVSAYKSKTVWPWKLWICLDVVEVKK